VKCFPGKTTTQFVGNDLGSAFMNTVGMRNASVYDRWRPLQSHCAMLLSSSGQSTRLCETISSSVTPVVTADTRDGLGLCHNSPTYDVLTRRSQHSQECNDPRRHCFVTRDLDLWPFYLKINGFPGLIVEHSCIEFDDPSFIGFLRYRTDVHTNRQTNTSENLLQRLPSAWVTRNFAIANSLTVWTA